MGYGSGMHYSDKQPVSSATDYAIARSGRAPCQKLAFFNPFVQERVESVRLVSSCSQSCIPFVQGLISVGEGSTQVCRIARVRMLD